MKNRNLYKYSTKNIFLQQIKFIRHFIYEIYQSSMCLSVEIVHKTERSTIMSTFNSLPSSVLHLDSTDIIKNINDLKNYENEFDISLWTKISTTGTVVELS